MAIWRLMGLLILVLALSTAPAWGTTLTGFVSNPTQNSVNWTAAALGMGAAINTNIDFETHPLGALQSNFYLVSDGVTLTATGDVNNVWYGNGPNDGNTFSTPLSSGEGLHVASNYLHDGGAVSSLALTFNQPVLGAGLFVIDYFNPFGDNPLTIGAYTGPNGTGTYLGGFTSVAYNFQPDHLYFMGLLSDVADIRSVVFTDVNSNTGDRTGIDNIRFAVPAIPEPVTMAGLFFGLASLGAYVRRRR